MATGVLIQGACQGGEIVKAVAAARATVSRR